MKVEFIYGYGKESLEPTGRWFIDEFRYINIEVFYEEDYLIYFKRKATKWIHESKIQEVQTCERIL